MHRMAVVIAAVAILLVMILDHQPVSMIYDMFAMLLVVSKVLIEQWHTCIDREGLYH